jgi:acyl-coenzyme A thioesterase PaaI-like protein
MVDAHGARFRSAGTRLRGTLTAEAEIVHRGRTTLAVEVTSLDE